MTKIVGINHLKAVAALQMVGFEIRRQSGHVIMTDGVRIVAIPRHNPVNAFTMGDIVKAVGLTPDQFRKLL